MDNSDGLDAREGIQLGDLFRPLVWYRRLIWQGTMAALLLAAVGGAIYLVIQPTTWSVVVGFRPTFEGAQEGRYPNALPFALSDIISPSVAEATFVRNNLQEYCTLEAFRSGFAVQENSPDLQFLNLDYQAQLSDRSLTAVDRQRLQEEYAGRRAAIEAQYELAWLRPRECAGIPKEVVYKFVPEMLDTWAAEAEERRGVTKLRIAVLSPAIFEDLDQAGDSLLVQADLLRTRISRVVNTIVEVEKLPGSETVRSGEKKVSFAEIRGELQDIMQARLDPLVAMAGRGLGRESLRWIEQALRTATDQLRMADRRAEAYRVALGDYTGVPGSPLQAATKGGEIQRSPSDMQALTTQIDTSFIDRIVALSESNTRFRQQVTRDFLAASADAVRYAAVVEYYKGLLAATESRDGDFIPAAEVIRRLELLTKQAKAATLTFNQTYEEFSRVSLQAGPALFRIDRPADDAVVRAFGLRNYAFLLLGTFLVMPIVLATAFLVRYHLQRAIAG